MTTETTTKHENGSSEMNVLRLSNGSGSVVRMSSVRATLASFLVSLCAAQGGAVTTEYAIIVGFCGITVGSAVVGLGPDLASRYERSKRRLIMPIP